MKKIVHRSLKLLVTVLLLSGLLLFLLLTTNTGAYLLFYSLTILSPVDISFSQITGSIVNKLTIKDLKIAWSAEQNFLLPELHMHFDYMSNEFVLALTAESLLLNDTQETQPILTAININFSGWPSMYQLHGSWDMSYPKYAPSHWMLQATGQSLHLNISSLAIKILQGEIKAQGYLSATPTFSWGLLANGTWADNHLTVQGESKETLAVQWQLQAANLAKIAPQWQGQLSSSGSITGNLTAPTIQGELHAHDLQIATMDIKKIIATWQTTLGNNPTAHANIQLQGGHYNDQHIKQATLLVTSNINKVKQTLTATINLALDKDNYLTSTWLMPNFNQESTLALTERALQGKINVQFTRWHLLQALSTIVNAKTGQLTAQLNLAGTLDAPQLNGSITFNKGEIYLTPLNISLENIKITLHATGKQLLTYQALLSNKQGQLTLTGNSQLQQNVCTTLQLSGENFLLYDYPKAKIYASPDLYLKINAKHILLTGNLFIPQATFAATEFKSYIQPSTDVVILNSATSQAKVSPWQLTADINLKLGDAVYFSGYGLNTQVGGKLAVRYQQDITTANGELQLLHGQYTAYALIPQ